jgi:hypothetical protein
MVDVIFGTIAGVAVFVLLLSKDAPSLSLLLYNE